MPRIPPPLVALAFALLSYGLGRLIPLGVLTLPLQSAVAVALAGLGLVIIVMSVREFMRVKTTVNPIKIDEASALVTSGPFGFTRNPMYLGMLLILTGVAVWLGQLSGLIALPLFIAYITRFQIMPEEAVMRQIFGDAFVAYSRKTRRWI
jgi:protein-S-isoprenylcysteine O-methyltransferase Ste14